MTLNKTKLQKLDFSNILTLNNIIYVANLLCTQISLKPCFKYEC